MAFEFDGYFHHDWLGIVDLEEIHVEDGILYRVELEVFEDGHAFLTVDIEFYSEDVGSVDEFANSIVRYNEVGCNQALAIADFYDFLTGLEGAGIGKFYNRATIEHYGDKALVAKGFSRLLAQIYTRLGCKFEKFHCNDLCYSKLSIAP